LVYASESIKAFFYISGVRRVIPRTQGVKTRQRFRFYPKKRLMTEYRFFKKRRKQSYMGLIEIDERVFDYEIEEDDDDE